jgi:hypothetical protein
MNCLQCAYDDRESPAVGICLECGAAVCLTHARIGQRQAPPVGLVTRLPARRVLCSSCNLLTPSSRVTSKRKVHAKS